jgi:hypothetical protein
VLYPLRLNDGRLLPFCIYNPTCMLSVIRKGILSFQFHDLNLSACPTDGCFLEACQRLNPRQKPRRPINNWLVLVAEQDMQVLLSSSFTSVKFACAICYIRRRSPSNSLPRLFLGCVAIIQILGYHSSLSYLGWTQQIHE